MAVPSPEELLRAFLVFVRIGGLFVAAPFFNHAAIPVRLRVLLAVLLAFVMAGFVEGPLPAHATHTVGLFVAVLTEALTGLVIGFAAQFVFYAVQLAGELIGFQVGLSVAQAYNPADGTSANPLGRFLSMTFLLLFLLLDGPHHLVRALAASFEAVPLAGGHVTAAGPLLLRWVGGLFTTALRLAAPFMVTLFLVDLVLGIFARVVPQADLFGLSFPIKLMTGLGVAVAYVLHFFPVAPDLLAQMVHALEAALAALAP